MQITKGGNVKNFFRLLLLLAVFLFPSVSEAAYDPTVGTWLSRDPLGEQIGPNLYQYVGNNPINWFDPLGLDSVNLYPPDTGRIHDSAAADSRGINPNAVTVGGHGLPGAIYGPDGKPMTVQQVVDKIIHAPDYTPKKPVVLYPCNAGTGPNSVAQQVSNQIPNPVTASSTKTWEPVPVDPNTGKVTSGPVKPTQGGNWVTYQNGVGVPGPPPVPLPPADN